jgi:hypothetical protein
LTISGCGESAPAPELEDENEDEDEEEEVPFSLPAFAPPLLFASLIAASCALMSPIISSAMSVPQKWYRSGVVLAL